MQSLIGNAIVNICDRTDITRVLIAKICVYFRWTRAVAFLSPDVLDCIQSDLRYPLSYVRFFCIGGIFIQRGIMYNNWSFEGPDQFAFSKDVFMIFWWSVAACTFEDVLIYWICLYRMPPLMSVFGKLDKIKNIF